MQAAVRVRESESGRDTDDEERRGAARSRMRSGEIAKNPIELRVHSVRRVPYRVSRCQSAPPNHTCVI